MASVERIEGFVSTLGNKSLPILGFVGPWAVYPMCCLHVPEDIGLHNAYAESYKDKVGYDDIEMYDNSCWLYFFDNKASLAEITHVTEIFDLAESGNEMTKVWRFRIARHQVISFLNSEAKYRWGDLRGIIAFNVPIVENPLLNAFLEVGNEQRFKAIWCKVMQTTDTHVNARVDRGRLIVPAILEFYTSEEQATENLFAVEASKCPPLPLDWEFVGIDEWIEELRKNTRPASEAADDLSVSKEDVIAWREYLEKVSG